MPNKALRVLLIVQLAPLHLLFEHAYSGTVTATAMNTPHWTPEYEQLAEMARGRWAPEPPPTKLKPARKVTAAALGQTVLMAAIAAALALPYVQTKAVTAKRHKPVHLPNSVAIGVFCAVLLAVAIAITATLKRNKLSAHPADFGSPKPGLWKIEGTLSSPDTHSSWFTATECIASHSTISITSGETEQLVWSHQATNLTASVENNSGAVAIDPTTLSLIGQLTVLSRPDTQGLTFRETVLLNNTTVSMLTTVRFNAQFEPTFAHLARPGDPAGNAISPHLVEYHNNSLTQDRKATITAWLVAALTAISATNVASANQPPHLALAAATGACVSLSGLHVLLRSIRFTNIDKRNRHYQKSLATIAAHTKWSAICDLAHLVGLEPAALPAATPGAQLKQTAELLAAIDERVRQVPMLKHHAVYKTYAKALEVIRP